MVAGRWVGLVGIALLIGTQVVAQPPPPDLPPRGMLPRQQNQIPGPLIGEAPGGELPGADPLQLLLNSFEIQHDLRLTAAQIGNLQLAARNFRTQMQALTAPAPGTSPDQGQAAIARGMADTRGMIARELTPEQLARLQQIMLQIEGPCLATVDNQLGQHLGLTNEQWKQLATVCHERDQQMRAAFRPPAPGANECQVAVGNRDRIEPIRARSDAQVLALLSAQQRTKFAAQQGSPMHLEPPMRPECR